MEVRRDKGFECGLRGIWWKDKVFFGWNDDDDEEHRHNIYITPGGFAFFGARPHEEYRKEKYMDDGGQEYAKTDRKKGEFIKK